MALSLTCQTNALWVWRHQNCAFKFKCPQNEVWYSTIPRICVDYCFTKPPVGQTLTGHGHVVPGSHFAQTCPNIQERYCSWWCSEDVLRVWAPVCFCLISWGPQVRPCSGPAQTLLWPSTAAMFSTLCLPTHFLFHSALCHVSNQPNPTITLCNCCLTDN